MSGDIDRQTTEMCIRVLLYALVVECAISNTYAHLYSLSNVVIHALW